MGKAGYFITGTDTGIGKTLVSCELLRAGARLGLRSCGMKPVASGATRVQEGLRNDDALALWEASSVQMAYEQVNPYCFEMPVAPSLAARAQGVHIDLEHVAACARALGQSCDWLIIEGVGGWLAPLATPPPGTAPGTPIGTMAGAQPTATVSVADLAVRLGLPVILVVGLRLGCLNHAALTLESIRTRGLLFAGWIGNQIDPDLLMSEENLLELTALMGRPALGVLPWKPNDAVLRLRGDALVEGLLGGG